MIKKEFVYILSFVFVAALLQQQIVKNEEKELRK